MEQQFKIRQIEDALRHPESAKEDIITVFLALQRQTFCLTNSLNNLLKHWPREAPTSKDPDIIAGVRLKYGTSSETKD
jgi:hypothetical protein